MALAVLATVVTLFGTVTRGPVTPVCEANSPCNVPATEAKLTFARPGKNVTVRTDAAGKYSVRLAPGTYTVRSDMGMSLAPARITVRALKPRLRKDFAIDTGIR
jgi:hypothetical protein